MKLTIITHVSVDGVMQGLGGPHEDRRDGFERGGWALPMVSGEIEALICQIYDRADAFLFGRRTYEIFAASWGTGEWGSDGGDNAISAALNTRPKYVASTTLPEASWRDTTVLPASLDRAIADLKAGPDGELQVHGSGELTRWLLERGLVDEMVLLTYPLVVGQGTRLFPLDGPDVALELVEHQALSGGVTSQVYRPAGRPVYATG